LFNKKAIFLREIPQGDVIENVDNTKGGKIGGKRVSLGME
jgi:hypothetical protein